MFDATVRMQCGKCGIDFCLPQRRYDELRETGDTFWCPNGHPRVFRETTVDALRKEVTRLERRVAYWQSRADEWWCPFGACFYTTKHKPALASHLVREHGANKVPARELRLLAAEAGPDAYGSGHG